MVDAVIKKAKAEDDGRNGSRLDASAIMRILEELERHDEAFLNELHGRLPKIGEFLAGFNPGEASSWASHPHGEIVLQDIRALHEAARLLEAKSFMLFFHGLQTFLTVASGKEVEIPPQRVKAVASQLQTIMPKPEEWIQAGKCERAAIQQAILSR
jgi:hypothetical protein